MSEREPWETAVAGLDDAVSTLDPAAGREEIRRAKRLAVLETGARLFNRQGYDRTKLDDIAAALSVSKRTLYYYVASKDDILFQCSRLAYETMEPAIARAADRSRPPLERIRMLVGAYVRMLSNEFGACLVLTRDSLLAPEAAAELRDHRRRIDVALRALIEEGQADGSIAAFDPKLASAAIFGAVNWLPHWRDPAKRPDYGSIAETFLDLMLDGLARRPVQA